jgi:hypothetical protein
MSSPPSTRNRSCQRVGTAHATCVRREHRMDGPHRWTGATPPGSCKVTAFSPQPLLPRKANSLPFCRLTPAPFLTGCESLIVGQSLLSNLENRTHFENHHGTCAREEQTLIGQQEGRRDLLWCPSSCLVRQRHDPPTGADLSNRHGCLARPRNQPRSRSGPLNGSRDDRIGSELRGVDDPVDIRRSRVVVPRGRAP